MSNDVDSGLDAAQNANNQRCSISLKVRFVCYLALSNQYPVDLWLRHTVGMSVSLTPSDFLSCRHSDVPSLGVRYGSLPMSAIGSRRTPAWALILTQSVGCPARDKHPALAANSAARRSCYGFSVRFSRNEDGRPFL